MRASKTFQKLLSLIWSWKTWSSAIRASKLWPRNLVVSWKKAVITARDAPVPSVTGADKINENFLKPIKMNSLFATLVTLRLATISASSLLNRFLINNNNFFSRSKSATPMWTWRHPKRKNIRNSSLLRSACKKMNWRSHAPKPRWTFKALTLNTNVLSGNTNISLTNLKMSRTRGKTCKTIKTSVPLRWRTWNLH